MQTFDLTLHTRGIDIADLPPIKNIYLDGDRLVVETIIPRERPDLTHYPQHYLTMQDGNTLFIVFR